MLESKCWPAVACRPNRWHTNWLDAPTDDDAGKAHCTCRGTSSLVNEDVAGDLLRIESRQLMPAWRNICVSRDCIIETIAQVAHHADCRATSGRRG